MQGIELSRRFYVDVVQPWLSRVAPGLRYSAAITGTGSELLGFDDETSKDHDWGPHVRLYLSEADFHRQARDLLAAFSREVPQTFEGEIVAWSGRSRPPANGPDAVEDTAHGLEIHTLEGDLEASFGLRSLNKLSLFDWLSFPEQRLLAFTSGEVFHDDGDRLETARRALGYFPVDVWHYRIASVWQRIAEEQSFVGRSGQVGDDIGSRVIAARLCRDVMALAFLLERRYAPYAKWFGRAFSGLPASVTLGPLLQSALDAEHWVERSETLSRAYLELARLQAEKAIAPFEAQIGPFHERPFPTINAADAVMSARSAILDPMLRALPLIGAVDQVSDSTPLLVDAARLHRITSHLYGQQ